MKCVILCTSMMHAQYMDSLARRLHPDKFDRADAENRQGNPAWCTSCMQPRVVDACTSAHQGSWYCKLAPDPNHSPCLARDALNGSCSCPCFGFCAFHAVSPALWLPAAAAACVSLPSAAWAAVLAVLPASRLGPPVWPYPHQALLGCQPPPWQCHRHHLQPPLGDQQLLEPPLA